MSDLKSTRLTAVHKNMGAKMAPFAGYEMPISYSTIKEEHIAVRKVAGMFDVSHMGEFIVEGKAALDLVQWVVSNNASRLEVGDAMYACLPNHQGGIVDDLLVYNLGGEDLAEDEHRFMLVVNASNIEKDWDWINLQNSFGAKLRNISDDIGLLAVQGPRASEILQSLTNVALDKIEFYHFVTGSFAGVDKVIISATGYTGAGGFELYLPEDSLVEVWEEILAAGQDYGLMPVGLGARDTLRLEMGYCLYGNDINDNTSPIEAGLGWITKTKKGAFVGRDIFIQQREEGVNRKLVGFEVKDRRVARQGYEIKNGNGDKIGDVTSGSLSPCLEIPIGMGYVNKESASPGTEIKIDTGRKLLDAVVVKLPFYKGS